LSFCRRLLVCSSCSSAWGDAEASLLGEALLVFDPLLLGDGLVCGLPVVLSGLLEAVREVLLLGEALLVLLVPP
jgi:hypothetical protein